MLAPVPYFEVVRQMPNAFNYRLRLVTHARQHGIKAAARAFRTTLPTVRKWLRRYEGQGLKGLQELSRAPRSCPHKIVGELAQRVVELRRQLPTFGARRLQREWELTLGHGAIERILREHGQLRPAHHRESHHDAGAEGGLEAGRESRRGGPAGRPPSIFTLM